jgi:hypothetical protein
MTGTQPDARPGSRRALTGAAVAVAVILLGQAASTAAAAPAAQRAALPRQAVTAHRRAPVPYRNAQLSVPGTWLVESAGQLSCGPPKTTGMIFAGVRPGFPKNYGCALPASYAWILPAGHIPPGLEHRKPTTVFHGIPVYRLGSGSPVRYLVPELGVRIGARGPGAGRVLASLARSPLSVVLRPGHAAPVPARWRWRTFGTVSFAVPPGWKPQHEDQWATCGTGLDPGSLLLINATKPPAALPCPFQIPTAAADRARPGLTVVTGKYAARSVTDRFGRCRTRRGTRICLAAGTGQGGPTGSVLIFSVSRPHHPAAAFFVLGLPGPGTRARAIFDSVRIARS